MSRAEQEDVRSDTILFQEILTYVENWPIAFALFETAIGLPGGCELLALNAKMRDELHWNRKDLPTYFDWLRATDHPRELRSWIKNPQTDIFSTPARTYGRLEMGGGQFAIAVTDTPSPIDWAKVCRAILDEQESLGHEGLLIVATNGQVICDLSGESSINREPIYVDQLLPPGFVDPAYALLEGEETANAAELGVRLHAIEEGQFLLFTPLAEPDSEGQAQEKWIELVRQLDGVAVAADAAGQVVVCSHAADSFWGQPLKGLTLDELLEPERNGIVTFSMLLEQRGGEAVERAKIWARLPGEEKIRVRVKLQTLGVDAEKTVILQVEAADNQRNREQTIHNLAHFDALTGLPNRQLFVDQLASAIDHAKRFAQGLTMMVIDIDRFQLINDSLGLEVGDITIRMIAERIQSCLAEGDSLARSGGDKFLLFCLGQGSAEDAARLARSIQSEFRKSVHIPPNEVSISVSIGLALFPHDGESAGQLVRSADTALGRAKSQGRNVCQFFAEDMNSTAFERLMLENRLRRALSNQELQVHYQPQVSIETGRIVGVEALLRWFHPELGMISPAEFIPLAEETGLIVPIGNWALEEACRKVCEWHRQGHENLRLAVNLSALQFEQGELLSHIQRVLDDTGLPVDCLELELTESVVMRNAESTIHRLKRLSELGIGLAVDDFGTGYSSLAYLKRFPLRSLKVDRSFVGDVDRDANSLAIVQAIVALGNALNIKLVAEGVETHQQLEKLSELGCAEMQGYLFSRPLPAGDVETLLSNHKRLKLAT